MAIIATIQHRRGNEADLDKSKLVPAEVAVTLDTEKVMVGFGSGKTKELASREYVQTLIDNFGNVVDAEIEYATKEIREEGERVLATIPDDFETTSAKADEAIRTKSDAIILTDTGERITNPMTSNDPMRGLKLYGKGEQRKTTGKQLLENTAVSQTINGVTFTVNEDKSVTVSGTNTSSGETIFRLTSGFSLPSGEYVLSDKNGKSEIKTQFYNQSWGINHDSVKNTNITLENDTDGLYVRLCVSGGATVNNITLYPMIRLATIEDGTYEPYTGGQPSPSLDYPQEIETCGQVGNLFDKETRIIGERVKDDGTFVSYNTTDRSDYIPIEANKDYILHNVVGLENFYTACVYDENKSFLRNININGSTSVTGKINTGENARYIIINIRKENVEIAMITPSDSGITHYRPYNGGQKEIETEVTGVQLLKMLDRVNFTTNEVTWNVKNGMCTASGTAGSAESFINTDLKTTGYKAGVYFVGNTGSNIVSILAYKLPNESYKYAMGGSYVELLDFSEYENIVFQVMVKSGVTVNETVYPMLHYGKTEQTWQPYSRQSHINLLGENGLPGIAMGTKIPNIIKNSPIHMAGVYWDEETEQYWIGDTIDNESGERTVEFYEKVLTGEEAWVLDESNNRVTYRLRLATYDIIAKELAIAKCTHYNVIAYNDDWETPEHFMSFANDHRLVVREDSISTLDDWKALLAEQYANGTPVKVQYILAEPYTEKLTSRENDSYRALHSNYPTTNVSNDCDAGMEVSMNADLKLYIANEIAKISTAILNN